MIFQESTIFNLNEDENLFLENNLAELKFLPQFLSLKKKYPEYEKYTNMVKMGELLIKTTSSEKINEKLVDKIFRYILNLLQVLSNGYSIVTLPFVILILPLIMHLFFRGVDFLAKKGEVYLVKKRGNEILNKLKELKNKTNDKDLKKRYQYSIDDIESKINKM